MPDVQDSRSDGAPLIFSAVVFTLFITGLTALVFNQQLIQWGFVIYNLAVTILFFCGLYFLHKRWKNYGERKLLYLLFCWSLFLRVLAVIFQYFFYFYITGQPFEFNAVDSLFYHEHGLEVARHFRINDFDVSGMLSDLNFSDKGYNFFLGFIYFLFGDYIVVPRLINAMLGSFSVLFIYRIAAVIFSKPIARLAGIMSMLMPNFLLYLGTHLKETVMLFLLTSAVYVAVLFIKKEQRNFLNALLLLILFFLLFMFRTAVAAVLLFSFLVYAVTYAPRRSRVLNRIAACFLMGGFILLVINSQIGAELLEYYDKSNNSLSQNLQFRATRDGGNKFALLAGAPLLLLLALIAPFPSWVYVPAQDFLWMFTGANLIRNIYAFFVIAALFNIIKKDWRSIIMPLTFITGYFIILANSGLALSERFQLPVVPFLIIFASHGIYHYQKRTIRNFNFYLIFIALVIIGWNYVKVIGRI